jgi:hypothetical protein
MGSIREKPFFCKSDCFPADVYYYHTFLCLTFVPEKFSVDG